MSAADRGTILRDLHAAPELLQVVNIWDVVSAQAVAALPETKALATAGHSIAATFGYADGTVPLELALPLIERIVNAVDVPVTADLDDGREDPADTVKRAIAVGVVGANVEDRLRPFDEAVARVTAVIAAAEAEGVPFALNARTDAFVRAPQGQPQSETIAEAISRGKAFLDAGATTVFVPGVFGIDTVNELVAGIGHNKVSLIGLPGIPAPAQLRAAGVSRLSYGPLTQRHALTALQDLATSLYAGAVLPDTIRALN